MPMYDYVCKKCGKVVEDVLEPYENGPMLCSCGEYMNRKIPKPASPPPFRPFYSRTFKEYITDKNRYNTLLKENNAVRVE